MTKDKRPSVVGMTALELYQMLEMGGFTGPMVCMLREQYLKTGDCSFDTIDIDMLNQMLEAWGSGPVTDCKSHFPSD